MNPNLSCENNERAFTMEGVYLGLSAASSLLVFFANFFTGAKEGDGLLLARRLPPGLPSVFLTGCDRIWFGLVNYGYSLLYTQGT